MLMLLRIKTLLKSVILPPAGPLLLAILGVFLVRRRPLLARTCLILGLGSLWLLSTPLVAGGRTPAARATELWRLHRPQNRSAHSGDGISDRGQRDARYAAAQFRHDARWVDDEAYDTFENARNSVRLLKAGGVNRVVLVTHATHMWRSVHEFTAAYVEVVPAPVGILAERDLGISRYVPNPEALLRACAAINELLGEPVRAFLAASHLRRH
jgi:uncharacterized SAM-binding protein YcdF (DUF218 family)